MREINHIEIKEKDQCCGCGACMQKCPKNAISLKYDEEGFWYPTVDKNKCIECGLCKKVCHLNIDSEFVHLNGKKEFYAAYNKNSNVVIDSSSGGVFWELVKWMLDKNGVVYGAASTKKFGVEHVRCENSEEAISLRKSKYLQSEIKNCYIQVLEDVRNGRFVLFSGTPCQIAGLYSFLGKEYSNLYTVDVVCHGVPSRYAFNKWLEDLEDIHHSKPLSMVWRDKCNGWGPNHITYTFEDGHCWTEQSSKNLFQCGFLKNLYLRPSCYKCRYARLPRIADVSLADYWGYKGKLKSINENKGISIVIISSDKGAEMWKNINNNLVVEERNEDDVKRCSRHVWIYPEYNSNRNKFFNRLKKQSFTKAAWPYLRPKNKLELLVIRILKRIYKIVR